MIFTKAKHASRDEDFDAAIIGFYRFSGNGTQWQNMRALLHFLLIRAGLLTDPLLFFALMSSVGRASLIFSINATALTSAAEIFPIVMLLLSAAATIVFSHLTRVRNHKMVKGLQRDMRLALSRSVLSADADFLLSRKKGHVYTALTSELTEVSQVAINLIQAIQAIFLLALCIPYLFWVSWFTGLTTVLAVGLGVIGYIIADIPARALVAKANTLTARFFNRVNDILNGWVEIRLRQARKQDLDEDIVETIDDVRDHDVRAEWYFSVSQGFSEAAIILLIAMNVVLLPLIDAAGTKTMFQVLTVILLTYGPIEQIFAALPQLSRAVSAQQRIARIVRVLLRDETTCSQTDIDQKLPPFQSIEFRNVCVEIKDDAGSENNAQDSFQFGPIDLTLKAGQVVFVTGGNGAGKTTFLTLLCGLRLPESGQILWNGKPVGPHNIDFYRSMFSTVLNQFHLFEKTYGLDETNLAILDKALKKMNIVDTVGRNDSDFTPLTLSTGQRRRLAMAVALAEKSNILVLDEYTADQDPANREYFYETLIPEILSSHDLLVAVTHDEFNFSKCDHLIKMDSGRVVSVHSTSATRQGVVK
jgi:cyclic peptide transporter